MKYEDFVKELKTQIGLNAKYFKPKENLILLDFVNTINKSDFEKDVGDNSEVEK